MEAIDAGFDFIDIASTSRNLVETVSAMQGKGAKVIVSSHDFEHPLSLEMLEEKHRELAKTGCDVIKIIGWTNSYKDNLPYLEYNKRYPGNVAFGMGELGTISRILAPLSGALYTYASLETGKELASGQIPLRQLREIYGSIER
jgi:3-dehydroquinate dehydratase type I